jgi:hypothetical protein
MIRIRRLVWKWRRFSLAGLVCLLALALVIFVLGFEEIAAILLTGAVILGLPLLLIVAAGPRAGLVWEGSYAEPWRAERSADEWSAIEAARNERPVRKERER